MPVCLSLGGGVIVPPFRTHAIFFHAMMPLASQTRRVVDGCPGTGLITGSLRELLPIREPLACDTFTFGAFAFRQLDVRGFV